MKARGASARGVAVIDDKSDLHQLAAAGIEGIRLNLVTGVETDPGAARRQIVSAIQRISPHNWHLQIYTNAPLITAIKDLVQDSPTPVVFDHFGGAQASLGLNQPGFADLIDLLHSAKAYVKISGAYRAATNYADVIPFAKALIAANPDRVIWGTDWPHPNTKEKINDVDLLNQLPLWSPDAAIRKKILVETPARLYNFR
jgi:predicted TIM-barrel fold metal-dependent hydrolase